MKEASGPLERPDVGLTAVTSGGGTQLLGRAVVQNIGYIVHI
jgi:hypothetical protein